MASPGSTYSPGSWYALVSPVAAVFVDPTMPGAQLDALWDGVLAGRGVDEALDVIRSGGRGRLPAFALASVDGSRVRIVVRGAIQITVQDADGLERGISGTGVEPWREDVVDRAETLWFVRPGGGRDGLALPVVTAAVTADILAWQPDGVARRRADHDGVTRRNEPLEVRAGRSGTNGGNGAYAPAPIAPLLPPLGPAAPVVPAVPAAEVGPQIGPEVVPAPAAPLPAALPQPKPLPQPKTVPAPVAPDVVPAARNGTAEPVPVPSRPLEEERATPAVAPAAASTSRTPARPAPPADRPMARAAVPHTVVMSPDPAAGGKVAAKVPVEALAKAPAEIPAEAPVAAAPVAPPPIAPVAPLAAPAPVAPVASVPETVMSPVPVAAPQTPVRRAGVLHFSTGEVVDVDGPVVIGRAPASQNGESARLVPVKGNGRGISRTHVRVAVDDLGVNVMDLGSRNGTIVKLPGGETRALEPGVQHRLEDGQIISMADVSFEFRAL